MYIKWWFENNRGLSERFEVGGLLIEVADQEHEASGHFYWLTATLNNLPIVIKL